MTADLQTDNVFKLEDPNKYSCHLMGYTPSHSEMFIEGRSIQDHEVLYFAFSDVSYFSGPINWTGANFEIAKESVCLEIARLISSFDTLSDADILKEFKLYQMKNEQFEVAILAANWPKVLEKPRGRFVFGR